MPQEESYIGDGVYVSDDGWHIVLRTPREGGDHTICLDPYVLKALTDWLKARKDKMTPQTPQTHEEGEES